MNAEYRVNGKVTSVFWDKDCVIYHHNSGNTHLISDVPETLLKRCLSHISYDYNALNQSVQQYPEFAEQDCFEYINQLLITLINKELIEPLN